MLTTIRLLIVALAAAAISGCGFFRVEIQQGNYITADQVRKLEPGMNKREVRYIMGTPLIVDPFHAKSRWDYYYAFSPDLGSDFERRRVTLFFKDDALQRVSGDTDDTELAEAYEGTGGTRVHTPTEAADEGFFEEILGHEEPPETQPVPADEEDAGTGEVL